MQAFPHKRRDQCTTPTKEPNRPNQQQQQISEQNRYTDTADLTGTQSKYNKNFLGLVLPRGPTLEHLAASMLINFATNGCNAAINMHWTTDMIEATIACGAHPSALQPEPAAQL